MLAELETNRTKQQQAMKELVDAAQKQVDSGPDDMVES
jgi:hypothetical protein